jgi:1-acyl-sn-glycerol-3-phosphate acyltransferase
MPARAPSLTDPILRLVRSLAAAASRWHRARCDGAEHLPAGPALLVGNHGIYGFEVPVFFYLVHAATGRLPIGLADRVFFGRGPMCALLGRCGGVPGTPENARALLDDGQLVVCYPGGSREVFKAPAERHRLRWERSSGFARLAMATGVPIVPFAGIGVDDSYVNFGHLPGTRALFGRYAPPFAVGLGPLPLPVQFRFKIAPPIHPAEARDAESLMARVEARVNALIAEEEEEDAADGAALAPAAAPLY